MTGPTIGPIIDGIVIGNGDPIIVKSVGGQTQNIPRDHVKSIKPLGRSLMMSPETMGLTAQAIADIAAFLQAEAARSPAPASAREAQGNGFGK